jgi:hypothetical protein
MYRFYIAISDFSSPVENGDYIECNPVFSKCSLKRTNGDSFLRVRDSLDGALTFYGEQYSALKTLYDQETIYIGIKVYWNSKLIFTGNLNLLGIYKTDEFTCDLNVETNDEYTKILSGLSKEFEPAEGNTYATYETWIDFLCSGFDDGTSPGWVFEEPEDYATTALTNSDVPAWDSGKNYSAAAENAYGRWDGALNDCFCSTGADETLQIWASKFDANFNVNPLTPGQLAWQLLDIDIGVEIYAQERSYYRWDHSDTITEEDTLSKFNEDEKYWFYPSVSGENRTGVWTFNDAVYIFDFLHDIILPQLDSNIEIEETGEHGYFTYFENSYPDKAKFYIKGNQAYTLNDIIDIYKFINCDWFIENDNGTYYFRFIHNSEISKSLPLSTGNEQYYLNDYININWTTYDIKSIAEKVIRETFKIDGFEEQWQIIDGHATEVNMDYRQQEIIYDNNFETVRNNALNFNIDTRLWAANSDGKYLMACYYNSGGSPVGNYVYNQVGVIDSTKTLENGGLACSRLVLEHILPYNRLFEHLTYLGTPYIVVKKPNSENTLKVPIFDQTLYDFNNLIRTDLFDAEIKDITIPLDGSIGQITIVK